MWSDGKIELELCEVGLTIQAGIDEAGRGPGAGDLFVAAVVLPPNHHIEGLKDSKKLTRKRRDKLAKLIYERAVRIKIVRVPPKVIDKINVNEATKQAVSEIADSFKRLAQMLLIDGNIDFGVLSLPYMCIIKGEDKSDNIAAASIIAKTARDNWMESIAINFPEYGFDKHKGYLTKFHISKLEEYGPCPIHRMSYRVKGKLIGDYGK